MGEGSGVRLGSSVSRSCFFASRSCLHLSCWAYWRLRARRSGGWYDVFSARDARPDRKLPEGLVINYKTIDHPLLNVPRKMKMSELIGKLKEVEAMMTDTGVKI